MTGPADDSSAGPATTVLLGPPGTTARSWARTGLDARVVEHPGDGRSAPRPGWTYEDVVRGLVDGVAGPLDLVGVSSGAEVALRAVVAHPDRVRSAVLVCADVRVGASAEDDAQRRRRGDAADQGMASVAEDTLARWTTRYARRVGAPWLGQARADLAALDPGAWRDAWTARERSAVLTAEQLAAVERPVTLVAGSLDEEVGLAPAQTLHELLPHSRLEVWPAPHALHLEHPEFLRTTVDRHGVWAPIGNRVGRPLGSAVLLDQADRPFGSAA